MELIILLLIVVIAICVFTGNTVYILLTAVGILLLFVALLLLVFLYCTVRLLFSKKREAVFVRIDKPTEKSKYKVAFYRVDGEEYPCLFPEEGILRPKLYPEGKKCHVFVNYRMKKVFDRFAVTTCILGLGFGILFSIGAVFLYFN